MRMCVEVHCMSVMLISLDLTRRDLSGAFF